MGESDFRSFAKAKGYSLSDLGKVTQKAWVSLQNDYLIFTVSEIEWLVRNRYVRKTKEGEWGCTLCDVPSQQMLTFFRSHFQTTHFGTLQGFYREQERSKTNQLR